MMNSAIKTGNFTGAVSALEKGINEFWVDEMMSHADDQETLALNLKWMALLNNLIEAITELVEERTNQLDAIQESLEQLKKR